LTDVIYKGDVMKDRCLTDEEITAYVDGVAKSTLRKRIEEHLSECNLCLHNVAELKQLVGADAGSHGSVPHGAMAKAENILGEHMRSLQQFDITAVLRNGICKILESTGELLPPRRLSPAPVRGGKRSTLSPRIAKSLSGYLVTIELTAVKDVVEPKLTLFEEVSSAKPDGVKAKLYSPGACETKYSHNGRLSFSPVGQGFFKIDIEEIGRIGLDIK
jgi:hypothetical protein